VTTVFVSGATGVLGRRVVAGLVASGHLVTGMARRPSKRDELCSIGVRPVALDLFDRAAVRAAVAGHDVVCNLATAIPVGPAAGTPSAWEENDRIRRLASRNLVDAALATGTRHFVQESIAFLYADGGDRFLDESAALSATAITSAALVAEGEAARFADRGGAGVALRFGQFYGLDSGHSVDAIKAVRTHRTVEPGPATAYRSPVTTDDAASAVIAALDAASGIYNVVDDRPLSRSEYVDALANACGVTSPNVPSDVPDLPPAFAVLSRSLRVSNRRFRAVTGWRPRFPSAWEGWASVVAEWRAHRGLSGAQ
jgi:nucleoside-diphosphate-sugar epimerase